METMRREMYVHTGNLYGARSLIAGTYHNVFYRAHSLDDVTYYNAYRAHIPFSVTYPKV